MNLTVTMTYLRLKTRIMHYRNLGRGQNLERSNVEDRYFGISKLRILKERKMSYSIFFPTNLFLYFLK